MSEESSKISPEHLEFLFQLNQNFNSSLHLDDILTKLMDEVISTIDAEHGFVVLADDNGKLDFWAARGLDQKDIKSPESQVSHSLIDQVLSSGEPVLTMDALSDTELSTSTSVMNLKLRAILCAPLKAKGETFGAIYLENRKRRAAFTNENLELLNMIAGQASMSIDNARLFEASQQRVKNLHLLAEISAILSASLDINEVLTVSLQMVQDTLKTKAGSILTVDEEELVFRVAIGEKSDEIKPFRIPIGHGIAGWVVENSEGVIVNDVANDKRFFSGADKKTGFVTEMLMAAPMIANNRTIGVMEVFNKPGGFTSSDLELLTTIAGSAAIALENARLYQVAVDKGKMEQELEMASQVQASLIPDETPDVSGWEFATQWKPARKVSGDYFDFIPYEDGHHGILIADVTDKGMPAALFMAFSRSIIRAAMPTALDPAAGMTKANEMICEDSTIGMPLTVFYGEVRADSGEIVYVNAGHNPPIVYHADKGELIELSRTGMLLGAIETAEYSQDTTELHPGDFIIFYTDGVTDAINIKEEEFGEDRLREIILQYCDASAQEIVDQLTKAVSDFIGEAAQFDDITLVAAKKL